MVREKKELKFEDGDVIMIWKYNPEKSNRGPFEVEIKYKKGYVHPTEVKKKTLGDLVKEQKTKTKKLKSS
jgi:hypothetical protein